MQPYFKHQNLYSRIQAHLFRMIHVPLIYTNGAQTEANMSLAGGASINITSLV
jgi:hypothetical protein